MRVIGNVDNGGSNVSAPVVVVLVCAASTGEPQYALIQVGQDDMPLVKFKGAVYETISLLEDFKYSDVRPQSSGGLHRRNISLSVASQYAKAYPFFQQYPSKAFYQCGQTADEFYFSVYVIDMGAQLEDIRSGLHLGVYKLNQTVSWDETQVIASFSLQDILQSDTEFVGATSETIPDFFFLYNQSHQGGIIPKAFGQIPRVKMLNAFPSFSIKKLANSVNGIVGATYTNVSATIVLEQNVDEFSVLKQLYNIGGSARIRMHDGEVIAGTLDYDSGTNTISLISLTRNTYYRQVQAYMDSGDGNTPDKWPRGPAAINQPNYSTVPFSPTRTVIPNAKELLLGDTGWLQADITFYDAVAVNKSNLQLNRAVKVVSLPADNVDDKTKQNVVIHGYWPDNRYAAGITSASSISTFFNAASNAQCFPPGTVSLYGWEGFELMKFYDTPKALRLFFNDPATAVGGGAVGSGWSLVGFEPAAIDYSGYLRNGYSKLHIDHVFVQGEGRLIKIPTGNIVAVSNSVTAHGLTNLMRVQLNMAPLDMGIGATSNEIYVDCLYKDADVLDSRTEAVIDAILQESSTLYALAAESITVRANWATNSWMPYIGWLCREETKVGDILDKIVFQCGINITWDQGLFRYQMAAYNRGMFEEVTITATDYIHFIGPTTDEDEMIEQTANITQGQLITEVSGGYERVPLFVDLSFGGWDDPYYKPSKNFQDRTISSRMQKFQYKFDLINDTHNFAYAVDLLLSIGHAAALTCCERLLKTSMTIKGLRWESQDPILFKDFPLITTADETDAIFDTGQVAIDDTSLPLYTMPASGLADRLCGGIGIVDRLEVSFGSGQSALVEATAKVAQLKVFPKGWGNNGGKAVRPGKPPTLPTDPNSPPSIPAGFGPTPTLPGFSVDFSPAKPELMTIDSLDTFTQDIIITINGNTIFSDGFPWAVSVIDTDIDVGPGLGVWLTGDVGGTIPTPTTTTLTKTLTVNVNYKAFSAHLPLSRPTREITLRFDLFKEGSAGDVSSPYVDRIYRKVDLFRVLPIEVEVS